jgi:hypothetical protein
VCVGGIISWLADKSLASQGGFCSMEFVCYIAGWCSRPFVSETKSNSEGLLVSKGLNYVMYVCHTVKAVFLRERC